MVIQGIDFTESRINKLRKRIGKCPYRAGINSGPIIIFSRNTPCFNYGDIRLVFFLALENLPLYTVNMKYKSNNNIVFSCKYHVVWCPKYRSQVLVDGVDIRLKEIVKEVCFSHQAELLELEVMPDHIHLLVEIDPQYGIHKLIKNIKGTSSRILRTEFPKLKSKLPTLWTNSYFVSTVGGSPLSVIKQYIENQKYV